MRRFKEMKTPVTVDFGPRDVKFPKYFSGNIVGNVEAEEIVLCLLELWQENEGWKAVFTGTICEKLNRSENKPSSIELGMKYLLVNNYLAVQRYSKGSEVEIFVAPTDKLLGVMTPFVQNGRIIMGNSGLSQVAIFNYGHFMVNKYIMDS